MLMMAGNKTVIRNCIIKLEIYYSCGVISLLNEPKT